MDAKQLAQILVDIVEDYRLLEESPLQAVRLVKTFEDANILLYHSGVVIECVDENGITSEFQISIVKSK